MANKTLNLSSAKASVIGLRISPRKAGEVASLVRGRGVADAITILSYTPRAAQHIQKLVASAAANATNNHGISDKDLQITSLVVGPGVRYKRFRPVARGSAHPYMHRTSNIYITVSGEPKAIKKADVAKADAKPKEVTAKVKKESK